jgi:peptide/nickel transport system permease protein
MTATLMVPAARLRRARVPFGILACLGFVLLVVGAAIVGPHFLANDANTPQPLNEAVPPSLAHLLGTDELGRDVLARLVVGAGLALLGPFVIALSGFVVSGLIGIAAGYLGGHVDMVTMRVVDFMIALPGLLLAIVLVTIVQGGYWVAVAVLAVLNVQGDIRLVRGATLAQRSLAYVEAARVTGVSRTSIMYRHISRNVITILLADFAVDFAGALVALAGLAFLGLGAPPGTADWGLMLTAGQQVLFSNPFASLGPGLAIVLLAVSVNLIGDWLYEWQARVASGR